MAEKTKKLESLDESNLARRNRELRQMGTGEEPELAEERTEKRRDKDDVNTPGTPAYLRRRQRDAEEDLKRAKR